MGFIRRVILPSALAVVTLAAGGAAAARGLGEATAEAEQAAPSAVTPLLSPRRLPEFITTPRADLIMRLRLIDVISSAPPDSCLVVEAGGREILAHEPDRPVVPASIHKTVLAAAILDTLGADHRFTTEVRSTGPAAGGVVRGDVWLVGGGDPQLSTDDYAASAVRQGVARTSLEDLADAVAAAGITRITGRLVADESRYDSVRGVATWRPDPTLTPGPLSALSVNDGFASFPSAAAPSAELRPAADPTSLGATTFAFLLAARGVTVDGGVAAGAAPRRATALATVESAPLAEIVAEMLTYSDNQTAELLLKELGAQVAGSGTTTAGTEALTTVLTDMGLDLQGTDFIDGSGLSDTNHLSCRLLVGALEATGVGSAVYDGLAVAGRSGTLAESFLGTPAEGRLRAKTGSLNDVTALAGFVADEDTDEDDVVVFSLVVNRPPFIQPSDIELRNRVGLVLADYPQRPPLAEVEPRPVAP